MGATTFSQEIQTSIAPEKFFKSLVDNTPNIIPKALPQTVKCIERGDGSIIKTTYTQGSQVKLKVEAEDSENLTCKYTLIQGELLGEKCESISYEFKFEPSSNGGSIIKVKGECRPKNGCSELHVNAQKEKVMGIFKATEGYLLANPAICA